ncbi:MAG: hypothetical protein ABIH65_01605 [Nanoarchaeota archaeon]
MKENNLIADNSFYSFFLDDTYNPELLKDILRSFEAQITPFIYEELKRCRHFKIIEEVKDMINVFSEKDLNIGEILRPLMSDKEINKGEHEVIALGYICHNLKMNFVLIIDDDGAIKFIWRNPFLSCIKNYLERTAGFIENCYFKYKIFNKDKTLILLDEMEKSKFFIDKAIIKSIKKRVKNG